MSDNPNNPFGPQGSNQPGDQGAFNQPSADSWGDQSGQQWQPGSQPSAGQPADPYNQPSADSWGQQSSNFGQQQPADPYGQQSADPYAQQQTADPYGQGYTQQQSYGAAFGNAARNLDSKGFFGALFDFEFNNFVTPKIVKFVYIVITVLIGIGVVGFVITSLISRAPAMVILALIIGPIVGIIYLALARMTLEMYFAIVRLSEDVHKRGSNL